MISFLETVLSEFRSCFSRKAAYHWFVVVILGLLTRMDKLGVTSFIRALSIKGQYYECLIHFFRSGAYTLDGLKTKWYSILKFSGCLLQFEGRALLAGDGTKEAKEGKHMPGVQKHHQESENCSKAPYIFGHMFGGLAVLIGNSSAYFAAPISMDIHLGLASMSNWDDPSSDRSTSHIVRMIELKMLLKYHNIWGNPICVLTDIFLQSLLLKDLQNCVRMMTCFISLPGQR